MKSYRELINEKESVEDLKGLLEVYEELSAKKMRTIRDRLIMTREFMDKLAELSHKVGVDLLQAFEGKKKTAGVLLSAQGGLYGDLIGRVFNDFLKFIDENKVEPIIIGSVGKKMFEKSRPKAQYLYLDLNETDGLEDELKEISKMLESYVKITVFYGKFKNIAIQNTDKKEMAGKVFEIMSGAEKETGNKRTKFIYEPSVKLISNKFGQNILTSMFGNFWEEHELAKQASRLMQLDQAIDEIQEQNDKLGLMARRSKKQLENKKQTTRSMRILI
ncbi:MAG: F0F1 ATP synthase subunit gamma [Patescibacteria group bacterium]|nr:F0F1 ATP synthase subunit gamma [Patescibacteria group bacterium]